MLEPRGHNVTWRELKAFIETEISDERLDDPVQITGLHSTPDDDELCPVISVGTIRELFVCIDDDGLTTEERVSTRSCDDNKDHPERTVLLVDRNNHSKDGDTHYEMLEDGALKGNVSGKIHYPYDDDAV